ARVWRGMNVLERGHRVGDRASGGWGRVCSDGPAAHRVICRTLPVTRDAVANVRRDQSTTLGSGRAAVAPREVRPTAAARAADHKRLEVLRRPGAIRILVHAGLFVVDRLHAQGVLVGAELAV